MIHRIMLSTLGFLALATCKNQTVEQTSDSSDKTEVVTTPAVTTTDATTPAVTTSQSTPVKTATNNEPEMSTGMPPDKAAVKQAQAESNVKNTSSGMIYLAEGEKKFLKEYEMNITFKKMIEDSRCPEGVNCIWEGVATAEIEVMGLATRPVTFRISSMQDPSRGYSASRDFNGYEISLEQVSPSTTSERGFKTLQGKYKIGINIKTPSPGKSNPNSPTTK